MGRRDREDLIVARARRDAVNEANHRAFGRLLDTMRSRAPLAFVGAGISARSGYPSWAGLLEELHERAAATPSARGGDFAALRRDPDVLWRAEAYRRALGDPAWFRFLKQKFAPRRARLDAFTRDLVRLGFSHWLTTNYDDLVERALRADRRRARAKVVEWNETESLGEFIAQLGASAGVPRFLVYLHGRHDQPERIVLTDSDYRHRYFENDRARRKLFAIFATKPIVFLGFSLDDPDFMLVFREVSASLVPKTARHFAILPLKESEESPVGIRSRLTGKYGVEPIFYPHTKDHRGLAEVVEALSSRRSDLLPSLFVAPAKPPAGPARTRRPRAVDPDDPQKGRWGGRYSTATRFVDAVVTKAGSGWYRVEIALVRRKGAPPLTGPVRFHLHDTFSPSTVPADTFDADRAVVTVHAYGAFTVGVEADGGLTRLERDLAQVRAAPIDFRRS